MPRDVLDRHVQVINQSHTPLPLPPHNSSSVGLVAYNLGYLPNLKHKTRSRTETETTLASLADAARVLRVGGMVSVMTYPRSHREEDAVVRAFLQGLALFSSITTNYETFVEQLDDEYFFSSPAAENNADDSPPGRYEYLRQLLSNTLEQVLESGGMKQTWRVYEHRKIGWTDAPILVTATRIK